MILPLKKLSFVRKRFEQCRSNINPIKYYAGNYGTCIMYDLKHQQLKQYLTFPLHKSLDLNI